MRLFCYRPGAIGDTILTAPALAWLRGRYPEAAVTLVARPDLHEILRASGLADAVLSPDDARFAAYFAPAASAPVFSERFGFAPDRAYLWMNRAEDFVASLTRAGAARVAVAPARPGAAELRSAAEVFCAFIGDADAQVNSAAAQTPGRDFFRQIFISAPPRAVEAAGAWLQARALRGPAPLLVLHVGAGGAAKRLPPVVCADLVRAWTRAGGEYCLSCGPADEGSLAEVTQALGAIGSSAEMERRTARLSLVDLAGLFTLASAAVGADSGPLHLAASLGVRTLVFYTASDPAIWRPIGPQASVVDCRGVPGEPIRAATLRERALDALQTLL